MVDVFISYKAEDRPRVRPLVEALEAEGLAVWWDAHLGGGEAWRETIADHLDQAKCVIVAWSRLSTGPEGRFVRDEAARAQRAGTYLPVTIDKVVPPLGFGEMQALALSGWKGKNSDVRYQAVSHAAHAMLGRASPAAARPQSVYPVNRRAVFAGGGIALVAAAAGGWFVFGREGAKSNTLAVLPFANLSGDSSQDYFSDGMAEELRSSLAALGGLEVVARTSSEMLRNVDVVTAARRLGVANVVTGSVRRSPSTVRVSAQLVDGHSGIERWSQSFDRPFGDVLAIQSDIASNVARALSAALGTAVRAVRSIGGTNNPQAQDFLLRAAATRGRGDSEKAMLATIALLDQAIDLDPNYAEAYAKKAQYLELWASQFAPSVAVKNDGVAKATESAERAIAIAPRMSLGYGALGGIHQDQLQLKRSLADFQRADALPGIEIVTLAVYALVLSQARRPDEARSTIGRAIKLDPLNALGPELQSWILFNNRRYADSFAAARQALKLEPERMRSRAFLGNALLMTGRTGEAQREFQKLPPDNYRRQVGEATIAARAGRPQDALNAIQIIERHFGDAAYYQYGQIYAQLGDTHKALSALETAWAKRDPGLAGIQVDPFLDPLRKDSRLAAISARVFG